MADIQIIMEVQGKEDVLKAAKNTERLEKQVSDLNKRFRSGKINQSDYLRGLNQLASKNKQAAGGYNNLKKAVFSYASSIDQAQKENNELVASQTRVNSALKQGQNQYAAYNTATYRSTQTSKRFASVGLQQVGYQVGDFAVQMQSGTNVAVAFGQQMSQLLGILGPFGAIAGAGVAIGTAIVAPLLDARAAASDLRKELESLERDYSIKAQGLYSEKELDALVRVRSIQQEIAILEKDKAAASGRNAKALENTISRLKDQLGLAEQVLNDYRQTKQELERLGELERLSNQELKVGVGLSRDFSAEAEKIRKAYESVQEEIGTAAANALTLAGVDMASGINAATKEAAMLAAQMGIAVEKAAQLELANRRNVQYAGRGTTSSREPFLQGAGGPTLVSEILSRDSGTSGGGAGGSIRQATQEANKFTEALNKMSGTAVELGKTMKDSVGGALMSIVDGTKDASDAFRDMARQILKKAFDLLVIQPLMDSLFGVSGGGGLFGLGGQGAQVVSIQSQLMAGLANGGALHNGRLMAFANGGVVDSPTLFPMANGAGLMGEAGPEAIMPLKRGKDGKLGVAAEGGNQPVNVTQQFIIQGNGDEYIMQKIKQSAPSIAQYTKNSLMDDRRRGGVVKQTFGG